MSASSKKKLRKEQSAAELTKKQQNERNEAKKLKTITLVFVIVMLVIALSAATVVIIRAVNKSGIIDRNTIAVTAGDHEFNSIQMNYYFTDYVTNTYSQYQSTYGENATLYMLMMGLDPSTPLNQLPHPQYENTTWADYWLEEAMKKAAGDYALYDMALAEGFTLSEDDQEALAYNMYGLDYYAMSAGFDDPNDYLESVYGFGADVDSYYEFMKITTLASAYYLAHSDSLTYDMDAIRDYEKDKYINYTSFDYVSYFVNPNNYLTGGTPDENGTLTYTDEEIASAEKAADEVAKQLAACKDVDELDKAIAALDINADNTTAASNKYVQVLYTQIEDDIREWLADDSRKKDDIAAVPNNVISIDENGNETPSVNGSYVVVFLGRDDNLRPLANVRHLLVKYEGGTTAEDGSQVYSDEEKASAKAEAEALLKVWQEGDATEESFIAMVKEHSDDGSAEIGGLFEDIHPNSNYVPTFLEWSIDEDRREGDVGIIESEYGCHIMYYSSDDELTYRDYMIREEMRANDQQEWYSSIMDNITITKVNTKRLNLDMILNYSY